MINALGDALMPISTVDHDLTDPKRKAFVDAAIAEIERYRTRDIVIPSYHNIVTVNCLEVYTGLMLSGLMKTDLGLFMNYSRYVWSRFNNNIGLNYRRLTTIFTLDMETLRAFERLHLTAYSCFVAWRIIRF
jgi:hypothetical protein